MAARVFDTPQQVSLFDEGELARVSGGVFPATRYQGSKAKLVDWIWESVRGSAFDSVLDAFGGTGCVAYKMKTEGKVVTYNDYLRWNWYCGLALIENPGIRLSDDDITDLQMRHPGVEYPSYIADTFSGIYFLDDENAWLDTVAANIRRMPDLYKQAIGYYALAQASISKRPYNLFHRRNLYIRTADVTRSFGNKTTWDTPFPELFRRFAQDANRAVFDNGRDNRALCGDAVALRGQWDLVYIDTPYISAKGVGVDYRDFSHFLEGLTMYDEWPQHVDTSSKHLRLKRQTSPWATPSRILAAFDELFDRYRDAIIVVSYRSDGIPSPQEIRAALSRVKPRVVEAPPQPYQYVLSHNDGHELLLIGT